MSIASRIESMEDNIRNAYTSIDNLGIDISNTNKNIYNISTLLDTFYERLPKVSGIGASLSLSPSMVGKIKLNEIQGNTLQNGTPTPSSPIPIECVTGNQNVVICGKNLFNKNNANIENGGWISLDGKKGNGGDNKLFYIKIQPNTTYTIQKIAGNRFRVGTYQNNNIPNGTKFNVFQINDSSTSITITSGSNDNYLYVQYLAGDTNEQQILDSIQIELGSTATTYEPYKGTTYNVNLGKNLFDKTSNIINGQTFGPNGELLNNTNFFYQNFYIPVTPNTTYTVSKTTGSNSLRICEYDSSKTFIKRNYEKQTITTGSTTYFIRISNYKAQINAMQLEKGSSSTSYSSYFTPYEFNGIGDYDDSIKKSTGKNLFDKDNANTINAIINGTTGDITAFNTCKSAYISCQPNTTYTVSRIVGTRFIIGTTTNTPTTGMVCNQFIGNNTASSLTITTGANDNYLLVFYYNSGSDTLTEEAIRNSIMINEGSTALPYEPYGKVWYVEKNIGKVVLNGSETWNLASTYTNNSRFVGDNVVLGKTTSLLSNYFVEGSGGTDTTNIDTNGSSGKLMITIPNSIATTSSALTTWLTSHNTTVLYQLSTPTYTEITNTELIEQLESLNNAKSKDGTTNINVTSEDLSMILNVGVLKGE